MRCKQGDMATVIRSINPANTMRIVTVHQYIGYFNQGEKFDYNGNECEAVITDNYWWIDTSGSPFKSDGYGEISRAYSPDTWLQPIPPDLLDDDESTEHTNDIVLDVELTLEPIE